jgi:hypothetical protein
MKYNKKEFDNAVAYYKKSLGNIKGKLIFVISGIDNEKAFYSFAPLSRAIHEKKGEMHVMVTDKNPIMADILFNTWKTYKEMKENKKNSAALALKEFIISAEKKTGKGKMERIFSPPEFIINADKAGFNGSIELDYRYSWFKKHNWNKLIETADTIWTQVYNLKKKESAGVGFELVPVKLTKPLEDHLDSYPICWAMMNVAMKKSKTVSMSASSSKESMLVPMERISDLKATFTGCELSKKSSEPVFKAFTNLSKYLETEKLKINDAAFFVAGSGYPGKHIFGQSIGYPSPNNKTRWQSPGQMVYKLDYSPQTKLDSRDPMARYGFTDTLPLDVFIKTCNVDWFDIKRKNDALRRIAEKSQKIFVSSNSKNKIRTELEVGLIKEDGTHRWPRGSDVDIREKINKDYYKKTGIKAGCMANLPGGEMFVTPEYLKGTFVGDVVISVNESMKLDSKNPLIISADKKGYKIVSGPTKVIKEIKKRKAEAMKQIIEQEKSGSLPKEITKTKKDNFEKIGEFAINTNPKAELCDYLIVNEKIKGMIHIALGSGFEADRSSGYHYDIVIDAKGQKLDIFGVDEKNKKIWAMKKGKLIV